MTTWIRADALGKVLPLTMVACPYSVPIRVPPFWLKTGLAKRNSSPTESRNFFESGFLAGDFGALSTTLNVPFSPPENDTVVVVGAWALPAWAQSANRPTARHSTVRFTATLLCWMDGLPSSRLSIQPSCFQTATSTSMWEGRSGPE